MQVLKTKFLMDGKDVQYHSMSKKKGKIGFSSKKHSLKTQGELYEKITSIVEEGKKRSQSIYSEKRRDLGVGLGGLEKYLKKPMRRLV